MVNVSLPGCKINKKEYLLPFNKKHINKYLIVHKRLNMDPAAVYRQPLRNNHLILCDTIIPRIRPADGNMDKPVKKSVRKLYKPACFW
jgi:hypothetical protein